MRTRSWRSLLKIGTVERINHQVADGSRDSQQILFAAIKSQSSNVAGNRTGWKKLLSDCCPKGMDVRSKVIQNTAAEPGGGVTKGSGTHSARVRRLEGRSGLAEPPKDVRQRLECRYGGLRESRAQAQKAASQCFASGGWGAKQLRCQSSIQSTLSGSAEPPPTPAIRLGQLRPAFPSSPSSLFITLQSCVHVPSSPRHKLVDSPTCEASLTRR